MKTFPTTLLILLLFSFSLYSQPVQKERPKVALVLSGGAAKGMAHIGVLKVLEEVGIEPDIITGTSMGSIIGGLYALGYSADTLEKIVIEQDWDQVLSDQIPLRKVIFEEKPYFENQLVELPFENGKFKTPRGLIYGQQIDLLLSRLALPAYPVSDFSDLPIPFKCVASDIVQGKAVVLEDGYLPLAMRSSMSIPTAFTPVSKDSMLLIDGGLIRNFPVAEAVESGADIVIGVYTGWQQADLKDLSSFSDIMLQAGFLLSLRDAEEQLPAVDVYIEPRLTGYSGQDFERSDSIIARGEAAARDKIDQLRRLAESLEAYGPAPPRRSLPSVDWIYLSDIIVEGNQRFSDEEVIGRSGLATSRIIQVEDLEAAITRLVGTNFFEKVSYRLHQENGLTILTLECIEKTPTLIRAAIHYDRYTGAGLLANYNVRNVLLPASRFTFTGMIADNYRFHLNYLKYLGEVQKTSLSSTISLTRDEIPIFQDRRQNETFRLLEFLVDMKLQSRIGMNHMLGGGLQREQLSFKPRISSNPLFSRLNYTNYNAYAFWEMNTLNSNRFPTGGTRLSVEFKVLNNDNFEVEDPSLPEDEPPVDSLFAFDPYFKFTAQAESFLPLHPRASIVLRPFAGFIFNPSNSFGDFYLVGAPVALTRRSIPFYGPNANQIVAQYAAGIGIGYQHQLRKNLFWSLDANAGWFTSPDLSRRSFTQPSEFNAGVGASVGYDSFLGPARLTLMFPFTGEDLPSRLNFFLSIGHRF